MRRPACIFAFLLIGVAGCNDIVEQPVTYGPLAFAMTADTPAAIANEDGDGIFVVLMPVTFPIRAPTTEEANALLAEPAPPPFLSAPWVREGDIGITADLVITNLDDDEHVIRLLLEARTEFHQHVPNVAIDEEGDILADFASHEQTVILPPGERVRRRITEEEITEAAVDFAAVMNGAPNANQVFYFLNQSTRDPRNMPYVPSTVPGLVGFNVGIRSGSAMNVAVELSLRLVDYGDRVARDGDTLWEIPIPEIVTPVTMEPEVEE